MTSTRPPGINAASAVRQALQSPPAEEPLTTPGLRSDIGNLRKPQTTTPTGDPSLLVSDPSKTDRYSPPGLELAEKLSRTLNPAGGDPFTGAI